MPKYTPEEKATAIGHAQTHGTTATAQLLNLNPGTIRRWLTEHNTRAANPRTQLATSSDVAADQARSVAAAAREERHARQQGNLLRKETAIDNAGTNALSVVNVTIGQMGTVEQTAIGLEEQVSKLADDSPERARLVAARDEAWRRVARLTDIARKQGLLAANLVQLQLEMAGEPSGGGGVQVGVRVAVGELMSDPEVRSAIAASLSERVVAARSSEKS